jgi:hypothetical protein
MTARAVAKTQAVDQKQTGNCHVTNWIYPPPKATLLSRQRDKRYSIAVKGGGWIVRPDFVRPA